MSYYIGIDYARKKDYSVIIPVSNCCNAPINEDSDLCSECGEHCDEN